MTANVRVRLIQTRGRKFPYRVKRRCSRQEARTVVSATVTRGKVRFGDLWFELNCGAVGWARWVGSSGAWRSGNVGPELPLVRVELVGSVPGRGWPGGVEWGEGTG
ncbi:unnamed protein product [Calypogeia fissa]